MKMIKIFGIIIGCLVLYFFIDYSLEYHYWKKTKQESINFIKGVVNDVKTYSRSDLEKEVNELQSQ
jgi:hypothetical protein